MPDYAAASNVKSSRGRIENDVELLKEMAGRVEGITERIIRNARALGYYMPTPEPATAATTPVITTLADALQAMDRALNHCSGSLNVFD